MAKAEFGTPKHLSNQMKARGLQKLKWYCQVCTKQCRDANGFQSHIRSESHLRNISNVTSEDIEAYSREFLMQFISELKNYHGEKRVNANRFYNRLIQDKEHIHLNSTKWSSLSQFIQAIAKEGLIRVESTAGEDEGDEGLSSLDISYINNSSDNVLRNEILKKSEEEQKKEEGLELRLLKQQIKRGNESGKDTEGTPEVKPTEREVGDMPVKIQLGGKKPEGAKTAVKKVAGFKISKPKVAAPLKGNIFNK